MIGDGDEDDENLIAEELEAYRASRAAALAKAELDPVLEAARAGDAEKAQQLLDADMTKISATDMLGRNVLQYAALSGSLPLVAALASAPYTVALDSRDNTGQQAIHQAAKGGHVQLVQWLVEVGETPIRTVDDHKRTVFHEAALHGRLAFLEWGYAYMVEREGIIPTERFVFGKDKDHNTCAFVEIEWMGLHFAAQRGHLEVVKWVIQQGISVVDTNLYKKTALDIALRHNHQACATVLKELTSTELLLRKTEKQVRLLQEKNRVHARDFGREKARINDDHGKTKQRLAETVARCARLEAEAAEKGQRIESLEQEVATLNASIQQILAAHRQELSELTAHLEGRTSSPTSPLAVTAAAAVGGGTRGSTPAAAQGP